MTCITCSVFLTDKPPTRRSLAKLSHLLPKNGFAAVAVFGPVLRQPREHGRVSELSVMLGMMIASDNTISDGSEAGAALAAGASPPALLPRLLGVAVFAFAVARFSREYLALAAFQRGSNSSS
jgi:hypothetical protein